MNQNRQSLSSLAVQTLAIVGVIAAIGAALALLWYALNLLLLLFCGFLLFGIIQFLEGFLITPMIQERALSLPPALIIATQVLVGLVAGGLGVLVATPLLGVIVLSIQMLYVQDVLDEDVELIGHQS